MEWLISVMDLTRAVENLYGSKTKAVLMWMDMEWCIIIKRDIKGIAIRYYNAITLLILFPVEAVTTFIGTVVD
jgi:hypothetical protein